MALATSIADTGYKCQVYEQIVEIVVPQTKSHKEALAFLVEGMTMMYTDEQSKTMLNGLIDSLKKIKDPAERVAHLDKQITTVYQAILVDKIEHGKEEDREGYKALNQMYSSLVQYRAKNKAKADYGGINVNLVPNWYKNKYANS